MTQINDFFKMIAKLGADWHTNIDKEYGNNDGTLIKAEFRRYINAEWSGTRSNMNDLVDNFWSTMDKDHDAGNFTKNGVKFHDLNALDETEIVNFNNDNEKYFDFYTQIDKYVDNNTKTIDSIDIDIATLKSELKNMLYDIMMPYLDNVSDASFNDKLKEEFSKANTQAVAKVIANNLKTLAQAEVSEALSGNTYGYDIANDKTLTSIIDEYIRTISGTENWDTSANKYFNDIKDTLSDIIDVYLATAGIEDNKLMNHAQNANTFLVNEPDNIDSLTNLDYLNTANSELNPLQKVAVKYELTKALNNNKKQILAGITIETARTTAWNSIMTGLDKFINGLTKADLENGITIKIGGTEKTEFNPNNYIDQDAINAELVNYYAAEYLNENLKKFEEELVNGITDVNATYNVYDSTQGEIILPADVTKEFIAELEEVGRRVISYMIANDNIDLGSLSDDIKKYIENYINGNLALNASQNLKEGREPDDILGGLEEYLLEFGEANVLGETVTLSNYMEIYNNSRDNTEFLKACTKLVENINYDHKLYELMKEQPVTNESIKAAARTISEKMPNIIDTKLAGTYYELGWTGKQYLYLNFYIDKNGDIKFDLYKTDVELTKNLEETVHTEEMFKRIQKAIKESLSSTEILVLGGEKAVNRLVQSAWIMAYNNYQCSGYDNTYTSANIFAEEVFNNFAKIIKKLETHPEYLDIYTMNTAFANKDLVDNLQDYHYGKGADGDYSVELDVEDKFLASGLIDLDDETSERAYNNCMSALLKRLIMRYPSVQEETITNIFRLAQQRAINTVNDNNIQDCPYGTSSDAESVGLFADDIADNPTLENEGYGQGYFDNRSGDDCEVTLRVLVQLTLYNFDKFLYAELVK